MSAAGQIRTINEEKMNAFLGKVVGDFGAALSSSLAYIGTKLGLYEAMANSGPINARELAERTGTVERYIREWLINQAAGGYVEYDDATDRYTLPAEQATALTDQSSPFYVGGGFYVVKAMTAAQTRILEAFKNGGGILWGDNDPELFLGTERFFRPGYATHLIATWIPSLTGVEEKLKAGAKVADIGCGHGSSTIIMAQAYPNSRFWGFDNHEGSISTARERAKDAGVSDRVTFEVANASDFPKVEGGYDLIAFFDCLHDMGDPSGAAKRASENNRKAKFYGLTRSGRKQLQKEARDWEQTTAILARTMSSALPTASDTAAMWQSRARMWRRCPPWTYSEAVLLPILTCVSRTGVRGGPPVRMIFRSCAHESRASW